VAAVTTPRRARASAGLAAMLAALTAVGACSKSKSGTQGAPPAPDHVAGTPHTDDVLDAWKSAGLKVDGFARVLPVPYVATYCERGDVAGVETLVCEYADDGAVDRGEQQLKDDWARTGVHTGVAVRSKRTLLSAVDRERHDPNGKTINQLVQAFRKL
jgi:hypothetical protein